MGYIIVSICKCACVSVSSDSIFIFLAEKLLTQVLVLPGLSVDIRTWTSVTRKLSISILTRNNNKCYYKHIKRDKNTCFLWSKLEK